MERFDQRQGFLLSALTHLVIIMSLASRNNLAARKAEPAPTPATPEVSRRVFMPPADVLRRLAPRPLPPPATHPGPAPAPTPPPPKGKDRISVGAPVLQRQKGPLELRRDDDLTKVAKGRPDAVPKAEPTPPPVAPEQTARVAGGPEVAGAPGQRRPLGAGQAPRGDEGSRLKPGAQEPSITSSLRNLEQRLQTTEGPLGLASGTGQQMGPLFFDPQGADFTVWLNHFKNEVYRNWIVPQPALMGFRGHVDLEFTVERDGSMSGVRLLKSSGTAALDRAAQNALLGSQLMRLPSDFAPERVTMQVTFFYNEAPERS